jgi:hypothetical protein
LGGSVRREHERAAAAPEGARAVSGEQPAPLALVEGLQRSAGNRAVAGMLRGPAGPTLSRWFMPFFPPIFIDTFALLTAGLPKASAPDTITLPKVFVEGLQKAWDKSLPGKKSLEQGGILVSGPGGYKWKPGKKSTSGTFTINYGDVEKDEKLLGSAHTHPYSKKEGGHTDVPFSAGDMANFVTGAERIKVVRSGARLFLIAKSKEWDDALKGASAKQISDREAAIRKCWNDAFAAATGKLPARAQAAAKAVAKKFDLLYYTGTGATLTMPEDLRTKKATK